MDFTQTIQQAIKLHNEHNNDAALHLLAGIVCHHTIDDAPLVYYYHALFLSEQGGHEKALHTLLELEPKLYANNTFYGNLATVFLNLGRFDDAEKMFKKAVDRLPLDADLKQQRANNMLHTKNIDRAIELFDEALNINKHHADSIRGKISCLLLKGDLINGFKLFAEARSIFSDITTKRFQEKPLWQGENLKNNTLLLHEQKIYGFGDMLQMVRYAIVLAKKAKHIIVECRPELTKLLRHLIDNKNITVIDYDAEVPPYDYQRPLGDIPFILKNDYSTIPKKTPYIVIPNEHLRIEEPLCSAILARDDVRHIGICWAGLETRQKDTKRSCTLNDFSPLFKLKNCQWISLQKGAPAKQIDNIGVDIIDCNSMLIDFYQTAKIISQLDLVITVDTAVAHVAGALNIPCYLCLAYLPDWRWLMQGDTTAWYPSIKIFRQQKFNDWAGLFDQIALTLKVEKC